MLKNKITGKFASIYDKISEAFQKRNKGVILIIIYTILSGLHSICTGLLYLFMFQLPAHVAGLLFLSFILGCAGLISSWEMWMFKKWGLTLTKMIYALLIPMTCIVMVSGKYGNSGPAVVWQVFETGFALWILLYLMKPEIKKAFR
ncbi:Uncharacterized protein dnl_10540 [Desulfonema limicola]|uniref:Uncharacterized protein n=1 Tax=Desulfonema limicola TaxID=45656 RepID=A0A975B4V5_9BACT|nr:hypothetical protein [Desulfonema limicola]QTA78814.1 Uncharacterized protein dnl_10540 [Desulfonema limicola]